MIASCLALLNENYAPILLFFFFFSFLKASWSPPSLGGKKQRQRQPFMRNICRCVINPPMGNGHATHAKRSICKYIGLAIYLFLFSQKCLYYLFLLCMLQAGAVAISLLRDNKQIHSFIHQGKRKRKGISDCTPVPRPNAVLSQEEQPPHND